jgi:hypothetical protein
MGRCSIRIIVAGRKMKVTGGVVAPVGEREGKRERVQR